MPLGDKKGQKVTKVTNKKCHKGPQSAKKGQKVPKSTNKCQKVPKRALKDHRVPKSAKRGQKCQKVPKRSQNGQKRARKKVARKCKQMQKKWPTINKNYQKYQQQQKMFKWQ